MKRLMFVVQSLETNKAQVIMASSPEEAIQTMGDNGDYALFECVSIGQFSLEYEPVVRPVVLGELPPPLPTHPDRPSNIHIRPTVELPNIEFPVE